MPNHINGCATESERTIPIQLYNPATFKCANGISQKPWLGHVDVNRLSFQFDITTNKKSGKEWKAMLIIRIVVLAQCGIKILRLASPNALAKGFGNGCSGEFLLGQLLPGILDTSLDKAQLRLMFLT